MERYTALIRPDADIDNIARLFQRYGAANLEILHLTHRISFDADRRAWADIRSSVQGVIDVDEYQNKNAEKAASSSA